MSAPLPPPPPVPSPPASRPHRLWLVVVVVMALSLLGASVGFLLVLRAGRRVFASSAVADSPAIADPASLTLVRHHGAVSGYPPGWERFDASDGSFGFVAPQDLFFTVPEDLPSTRQEWTATAGASRYGLIIDERPWLFEPDDLRGYAVQIWDHDGALVQQGPVYNGDHEGYRITIARDDWLERYRMFVVGDRVYLLYVVAGDAGQHEDAAERFLASLAIGS